MPEGYSYEIREDAEAMYVTDGMTYDQVAAATGVSVAQLKRWGTDEDWTGKKKEYRDALSSIRRDTVKLRAKLLQTALASADPQSVYAFAAIERAVAGKKSSADDPAPAVAPERLKDITTPESAIEALQEVVNLKLNKMLAQPDILQLSQVKDIKQTMELIDSMKAKYAPEGDKEGKTLSAENIKGIREMLKL